MANIRLDIERTRAVVASRLWAAAVVSFFTMVASLIAAPATAVDTSAPAILQWFDSTYGTQEKRVADLFRTGYGSTWIPPAGRADSGNQSVG